MKPKALWERYRSRRRTPTVALSRHAKAITPKPFQPLTYRESVAVLKDAIQWLEVEMVITFALPNGPFKQRRLAELQGRNESMARDFEQLSRKQQ
jgi:hypothetical protein